MSKQKSWIAVVLCAAMFAVAHGTATQQIVRSGETMAWPHAYAYYRFVTQFKCATGLPPARWARETAPHSKKTAR